MATLFKLGSGGKIVADKEALEALGFLNVPDGVWEMRKSSSGSSPTLDHQTVIPLVGRGWGHGFGSNSDGTSSANVTVKLNNRTVCGLNASKRNETGAAGWNYAHNSTAHEAIFYPYFYDNDLTQTMMNINYTGGWEASEGDDKSPVYLLYCWLVKVG